MAEKRTFRIVIGNQRTLPVSKSKEYNFISG